MKENIKDEKLLSSIEECDNWFDNFTNVLDVFIEKHKENFKVYPLVRFRHYESLEHDYPVSKLSLNLMIEKMGLEADTIQEGPEIVFDLHDPAQDYLFAKVIDHCCHKGIYLCSSNTFTVKGIWADSSTGIDPFNTYLLNETKILNNYHNSSKSIKIEQRCDKGMPHNELFEIYKVISVLVSSGYDTGQVIEKYKNIALSTSKSNCEKR